MGVEEDELELVDQIVFRARHDHLSDLRREIFRGALAGQTYEEIAASLGYTENYVKEEGAILFRTLSDVLGERVNKTNFRAALERYHRPAGSDPNFIGREVAIAELNQLIEQGAKLVLIQGEGGKGKTTLARKYFKTQGFDRCLELWMAAETRNITLVESVVEEWLRRDFNEEPGRDFGINLDRLKRKLRDETQRIGILIDNLETALDKNGKFVDEHRPYVDLLRTLSDPSVRSITLITSRERLSESSVTVERYGLQGLDEQSWRQFFRNRGIHSESTAIAEMCRAYGGNAKAMKLFSGVILHDFDGDVDGFWQEASCDLLIEPELKDLVASQFNRLAMVAPEVHQLLCRLGCYRYQEIHYVPLEGLTCLLWDVPEEQRRGIIRALQDRSLIEIRKGKYWLHPVIRAEAIARLRRSDDWQTTHQKAAEFWISSVQRVETVDDALRNLEAYYHYLEIQDFERACDVLYEAKNNRWGGQLGLGWLFHRLGLLQQMISAITGIIPNVQPDYRTGALYNLLGYTYRLAGSIHEAIACHQQADQIAEQLNIEKLKIAALFNQGLCLRDLGELETAVTLFNSVHLLANSNQDYQEYILYSLCCLAYLKSRLGLVDEAYSFAEQAQYHLTATTKSTFWGQGYSLLFLGSTYRNLGEWELALQFYQDTIQLSEANQFTQIRAKALHSLARLHREQNNLTQALELHLEAIGLLDKLGAKCDLGEACYHLGLTYQSLGDRAQAEAQFLKSLQIFTDIQALKQSEQVQHALQTLI